MIDLTKKWETRGGLEVILAGSDGHVTTPIKGHYKDNRGNLRPLSWTEDGAFLTVSGSEHTLDLVPVAEKKNVPEQWIWVDEDGTIFCGNKCDNGSMTRVQFPEQFLVVVEEEE